MSEYIVLQEWLDQNSTRNFPLDDSAGGLDTTGYFSLPPPLLVDLFICAPLSADPDKFFLAQVVARTRFIDIAIGYLKPDLTTITVAKVTGIPADSARNTTYQLEPVAQSDPVYREFGLSTGVVVIGSCEQTIQHPGQWNFTYAQGRIVSARVSRGLSVVQSISNGTDIFTGNIVLKEGSNVRLTPSYDALTDTTTIVISADIGGTDSLAYPLVDDASILNNLVAEYGRPIATINGIKPDPSFNFTLTGLDCTSVTAPASYGISVANPCAKPCCDKSMLDNAYTALSELNLRFARMEAYYTELSRNLNDLQARLVALQL